MRQQYREDLKRRVVYQHEILGFNSTHIAKHLNMSLRVVQRTLQLWRETNHAVAEQGRPELLDIASVEFLLDFLDRYPDIYIDEISNRFLEQRDTTVSLSTIQRTLKLLGITSRKLSRMAAEQFEELHNEYLFTISKETPERLVFTDENSINIFTICREYIGQRTQTRGSTFSEKIEGVFRYSILSGLSLDGFIYAQIVPGSFYGTTFKNFLTGLLECMNPYPGPKSVLIMDNCAVHIDGAQELCDSRGVKLIYLPPYSPDFNSIEEYFTFVKDYIHVNGLEFCELVERGEKAKIYSFIYDSLSTVPPDKARDCFRHSHC